MFTAHSMKKQDVLNCRFSNWYPIFKQYTIKSVVIPLENDFVSYLQELGTLMLPRGVQVNINLWKGNSSEEEEQEEDVWEDEKETENSGSPEFSKLISQITEAIANLGGSVFPKMGWSSPKDAIWINNNSLKCCSPGEVILLLKSSDFISHDLTSAFKLCDNQSSSGGVSDIKQELVLRKWANLFPGMEFRCFIKNKKLLGISQRDHKQYYDYIDREKEQLAVELCNFIEQVVAEKFSSQNYVIDLYKKRNGEYWIIDFNPFGEMTDALLFTWNELQDGKLNSCEDSVDFKFAGDTNGQFRFASSTSTLQPSEFLSYRMPVDFVHLSTGADATKFVDFLRMKTQNDQQSSSDDDSDQQWRLPDTSKP
ncbi:translation initiation factor eIF2 assembly protein-like [Clavelina lepadiformis]|uniref:Translation initiation factor eIF2 assembly protein n=1 Tax=Clavelina lepadiformis TaxID=159417 RepID=A0ABP0GEG2_CLALP